MKNKGDACWEVERGVLGVFFFFKKSGGGWFHLTAIEMKTLILSSVYILIMNLYARQ